MQSLIWGSDFSVGWKRVKNIVTSGHSNWLSRNSKPGALKNALNFYSLLHSDHKMWVSLNFTAKKNNKLKHNRTHAGQQIAFWTTGLTGGQGLGKNLHMR